MKFTGDKRGKSLVVALTSMLFLAACASVATKMSADAERAANASGDYLDGEVEPPPFVPPPEPADAEWAMPAINTHDAEFPYLPGESREVSRSVGNVTHGWLVNAKRIPQPHPHLKSVSVQYDRGLNYTSDTMLGLLEEAGEYVAEEHPGSLVPLGNFSRRGGGDIPYSVSHNSGRDGDLGFFARDEHGEPVELPDLLSFDANGTHESDEGEFYFDAERNWTLVEGLIEADDQHMLQYIFISNPLKRILLEEARRQGAANSTIRRARVLLRQPGGALPHNDHFHIRIYCSELDVRSGCQNQGRKLRGFKTHRRARIDTVNRGVEALEHEEADVRRNAVRRLALLNARGQDAAIAKRLDDESPRVRAASARALGALGRGSRAIAMRLSDEEHPHVVAEMISALGRIGDTDALEALVAELSEPRSLDLAGELDTDGRALASEALVEIESAQPVAALIDLLESERADVRLSAARALRVLTNHQLADRDEVLDDQETDQVVARWREWYDEHGDRDRDEWLTCGFRDAGYEVDRLSVQHVWDLCRAVADDDYLSYNAQRVLMRLSGRQPASLSWSKEDANFYWRRWFERRWRNFGAPPIPEELSTLD